LRDTAQAPGEHSPGKIAATRIAAGTGAGRSLSRAAGAAYRACHGLSARAGGGPKIACNDPI